MRKIFLGIALLLLPGNNQATQNQNYQIAPFEMALTAAFFPAKLSAKRKNEKYKAPDFVQKQAQAFLDALVPQNFTVRFLNRCKKAIGCIIVYEGAYEDEFKKTDEKANTVAFASGFIGIHFPANSFTSGFLTNFQLGVLCHEICHVYYSHLFDGKKHEKGSQDWYRREYQAESKTIEVLFKLNMYQAAIELLTNRIKNMLAGKNLDQLHPYIFGIIDSFCRQCKNHLHTIKNIKIRKRVETMIKKSNNHLKTWKDRYKEFTLKKNTM